MHNALKNWPMTLLGVAGAVLEVIQAFQAKTWADLFTPPHLIAVLVAGIGFLGKWQAVTGTAANPRAEYQGDPIPLSPVIPPLERMVPPPEATLPSPLLSPPVAPVQAVIVVSADQKTEQTSKETKQ